MANIGDKNIDGNSTKKYGYWIHKGILKDYPKAGVNKYHLLVCAECGCMYRTRWLKEQKCFSNSKFCPNCGIEQKQAKAGLEALRKYQQEVRNDQQ